MIYNIYNLYHGKIVTTYIHKRCEEDQTCCETNGRARCCSGSLPWWGW